MEKKFEDLSLVDDEATKQTVLQGYYDILREIDLFDNATASEKKNYKNILRNLRSRVQNDLKGLERALQSSGSHSHRLNSQNISYYQSVWDAAKRSSELVTVLKRGGQESTPDIIADGGSTWIKISTLTERRLLFEMANHGWVWDVDDDDTDDEGEEYGFANATNNAADDDVAEISLVKTAKRLVSVSKETFVHYKHPRVIILLTKINYGSVSHIDELLKIIKATGVTIITADEVAAIRTPSIEEALPRMSHTQLNQFSPTLNIDCTVLLALVSDISNADKLIERSWFNRAIRQQVELEKEEKLLPKILWPTLDGKSLVCTKEAATRMKEITDFIGTETEKARMKLLLDESGLSGKELRERMQVLCHHTIPDGLQLPIRMCDKVAVDDKRLPAVASKVAEALTEINQAVFLFGWAMGYTTITSNRTALKTIEHIIITNKKEAENIEGPDIWFSTISRSLLAKEKDRKGK